MSHYTISTCACQSGTYDNSYDNQQYWSSYINIQKVYATRIQTQIQCSSHLKAYDGKYTENRKNLPFESTL